MSFLGAQKIVEGHPLAKNVIEITSVHSNETRPFTVGLLKIGRESIYRDEESERVATLSLHFSGENVTFTTPYWLAEPFRFDNVSIVVKGEGTVDLLVF